MIKSCDLIRIKELYELFQTKKLLGLKPEPIPYYKIPDYLVDISNIFIIYLPLGREEMTADEFFTKHGNISNSRKN